MKKWLAGGAAIAIAAGGVAIGVSMASGESETVDTTLDGGAQTMEASAIDASDRAPEEGIDAAIEKRQATLILCDGAAPAALARLADRLARSGEDFVAASEKEGCKLHRDPASFGGPIASTDTQFGPSAKDGSITYLAGRFSLGNPGGTGTYALGIARWDTKAAAIASDDRIALDPYIDFMSAARCEEGPALTHIRTSVFDDGSAFVGPFKLVDVQKVGPDKDDVTRRTLPLVGTWHGLPFKALRFSGQDGTGVSWMDLVFDAPADVVGPVLSRMGFGVRKAGDIVEKTVDDVELSISLTSEKGSAVLTCDMST